MPQLAASTRALFLSMTSPHAKKPNSFFFFFFWLSRFLGDPPLNLWQPSTPTPLGGREPAVSKTLRYRIPRRYKSFAPDTPVNDDFYRSIAPDRLYDAGAIYSSTVRIPPRFVSEVLYNFPKGCALQCKFDGVCSSYALRECCGPIPALGRVVCSRQILHYTFGNVSATSIYANKPSGVRSVYKGRLFVPAHADAIIGGYR